MTLLYFQKRTRYKKAEVDVFRLGLIRHGNTVVFLTDIFKRIDMPPEDMDKIGSDEKQRKSTGNCFPITETLLPIEHVAVDRREAVKSKLP